MADKIERSYPDRDPREIFDRVAARLSEIATRYSLKVETDPGALKGRVHRTGADVKFSVSGVRLDVLLDFSFVVPGKIRERVKEELAKRLDSLFSDTA